MASETEGTSAGSKRRRPSGEGEDPAPVPTVSPKLDSTIEAILRKKVRERQDLEKKVTRMLARIEVLTKHASERTVPSGLRIQRIRAKGQDVDLLQSKFDEIIFDAELKLLDAAIDDLRRDVKDCKEAINAREMDIDGTIGRWQSHLAKLEEITANQAKDLVDTAAAFVAKLSLDSAVSRASKALQAEISQRESKRDDMDSKEQFIPDESSIREIIRQELHNAQESKSATGSRQRKVSFSDNTGGRSRPKRKQQQQRRPQNRSKSPQHRGGQQKQRGRSKSPRSNSTKRVTSPRSSSKNAKGKGSGPVK